jgi:hypothetical protein
MPSPPGPPRSALQLSATFWRPVAEGGKPAIRETRGFPGTPGLHPPQRVLGTPVRGGALGPIPELGHRSWSGPCAGRARRPAPPGRGGADHGVRSPRLGCQAPGFSNRAPARVGRVHRRVDVPRPGRLAGGGAVAKGAPSPAGPPGVLGQRGSDPGAKRLLLPGRTGYRARAAVRHQGVPRGTPQRPFGPPARARSSPLFGGRLRRYGGGDVPRWRGHFPLGVVRRGAGLRARS